MKIFLVSFVLLSVIYGLNGHCLKHQPGGQCEERVFSEPEQKEIHYIYHGETCDCPRYHDVVVEKPVVHQKKHQQEDYGYNVEVPKQTKEAESGHRYIFDVRVEQPVEKAQERRKSYDYNVHVPQKTQEPSQSVRYIFDSRVEQPVKSCEDKPWQGLVAQVDRVLMPSKGCQNSEHTPETCNCGCSSCGQKPESCTCGNDYYKLPIVYNSRYELKSNSQNFPFFNFSDSLALPRAYEISSKRQKRDSNPEKKLKSKRREINFPKLKSLKKKSPKEVKPIEPIFKRSKKSKTEARQSRPKRKPESPCGYTYESCDPKKHSRDGCPLCYKCKCEPVTKPVENAKFSPHDIKVPYKVVTHDYKRGTPIMNQEFDNEAPSYTGLKEQEMYKKYIKQVVSKYPEHMARKMPDMQNQQKDLLKFIGELSKSNKSEGKKIDNEDVRYKMMDNAMDMYKYYEKATMPKIGNDGKFFKKRGTVLEVIELDPEDYNGSSYGIPVDGFGDNYSSSQ